MVFKLNTSIRSPIVNMIDFWMFVLSREYIIGAPPVCLITNECTELVDLSSRRLYAGLRTCMSMLILDSGPEVKQGHDLENTLSVWSERSIYL